MCVFNNYVGIGKYNFVKHNYSMCFHCIFRDSRSGCVGGGGIGYTTSHFITPHNTLQCLLDISHINNKYIVDGKYLVFRIFRINSFFSERDALPDVTLT